MVKNGKISTGTLLIFQMIFLLEIRTFGTKIFSSNVVRFFILQTHYRSPLDFSNDALKASEKGYNKTYAVKSWRVILPIWFI